MHKFEGFDGPVYVDLGEIVAVSPVPERSVCESSIDLVYRTTILLARTQLTLRGGGIVHVKDSAQSIAALIEQELAV